MTLLTPLKRITTLKLSKLPIFAGAAARTRQLQPQTPLLSPSDPQLLPLTPIEILEQIGGTLAQWREYYQLSIDDMSVRTQIQPRLIQAIEAAQVEMLPESIYVKGMIKRYADSLGLNGAEIVQHLVPWEPAVVKFKVVPRSTIGFSTPQLKPVQIYLGYTLAIFGIGAGTSHLLNSAVKPPAIGLNPLPIEIQQQAVVTPVATQLPDVKIGIAVTDPTWAQIGIDGTTKFTGILKVGTRFDWTAKKQVTINTNNAGGLLFARDGQALQPLGKIGQKLTVTIKVMK